MRYLPLVVALLLALALPLAAEPTIVSITPASGPAAGGTQVTITGTGFSTCLICSPPTPPLVRFGDADAAVQLVNGTTLTAIAPPHSEGRVSVTVAQWDGTATLANAFEYVANTAAVEPVLLPIMTGPVRGAYGSEFHTVLLARNTSGVSLPVYGIEPTCIVLCPTVSPWLNPTVLPSEDSLPEGFNYNGNPGRLIYVPKGRSEDLAVHLRVFDITRDAMNFGTEMPIVRDSDFRRESVTLLGVPMGDSRFRDTLRIYSANWSAPLTVRVRIGEFISTVELTPGRDEFEPAYAEFTIHEPIVTPPLPPRRETVIIELPKVTPATPPIVDFRLWAFVTVTNNETQMITTISPQ